MGIIYPLINNIFSIDQIDAIHQIVKKCEPERDEFLGRVNTVITITEDLANTVTKIAKEVSPDLFFASAQYAEYNGEYGKPNLPPHLDAATYMTCSSNCNHEMPEIQAINKSPTNDLILSYQLSSNTNWGIGVDTDVYIPEDNSGVLFNPNSSIHWRTIKEFKGGEYVKMLFFRFATVPDSNYSHIKYTYKHDMLDKVSTLRDSLQ